MFSVISPTIPAKKGGLPNMRNFKRKWTLDRTKYMTAPEVTELQENH